MNHWWNRGGGASSGRSRIYQRGRQHTILYPPDPPLARYTRALPLWIHIISFLNSSLKNWQKYKVGPNGGSGISQRNQPLGMGRQPTVLPSFPKNHMKMNKFWFSWSLIPYTSL